MTIEQQLKDFAANPIAGGVRWGVDSNDNSLLTHFARQYIRLYTHRRKLFFISPITSQMVLKSTTLREACEEAIALVKSRAKEIYEALGGVVASESITTQVQST